MENPVLAKRGIPVVDIAAGKVDPESASTTHALQAARLKVRFGLVIETAAVIAALAWGVAR